MTRYHLQLETTTGPRFLMGHPNGSKVLAAAQEIVEAMRRGERPDTNAVRVLRQGAPGRLTTAWEYARPDEGNGSTPLLDFIAHSA